MINISDKTSRENQNTHIMLNNFFLNSAVYEIMWKNIVEQETKDENMAHVHCMLDTQSYKHTLRICNTY
jgi:hypothetical protein